jgi:hypothetical protein
MDVLFDVSTICFIIFFFWVSICFTKILSFDKFDGLLEELATAQDLGGSSAASGLCCAANLWLDIAAGRFL